MTSLKDLQEILANTKPPKQLLHYFPNGKVTPLYMFEAVTKITGDYHGGVSLVYNYKLKFLSPPSIPPALFIRGEVRYQSGQESSRP